MLIDGLTLKTEKNSNGKEILRFYADDKGKNRYIQVEKHGNGAATFVYLEDGVVPGIEEGEELELLQQSDKYLERLVRAMAYLHMDVEDAANGYTMIDAEFIRRGFQIRFALDGFAAWVKTGNVATIVMSKLEEKGFQPRKIVNFREFLTVLTSGSSRLFLWACVNFSIFTTEALMRLTFIRVK